MSFTKLFLLGSCVLSDRFPLSGGSLLDEDVVLWMSLHDAVEVNCKKDATTENKVAGVWYRG